MDSLSSAGYDTDKGSNYLAFYEAFFAPHRSRPINLLELGLHRGGSAQMWRDYFQYGQVFGVDLNPVSLSDTTRIHVFVGDATDRGLYDHIATETGIGQFDIIIDDASHIGANVRKSFEYLFRERLAPGGIYVIEDWGTGYMQGWPDGAAYAASPFDGEQHFPSHDAGVVGYVKSLVDHVGRADVVAGGGQIQAFPIEFLTVAPGLVFMKKSA
jgi:SAM-dependent methyltransferase